MFILIVSFDTNSSLLVLLNFLSPYEVKVAQLCTTLCDLMDCIVHRILQARILEWVAVPFSRGSSLPRDQSRSPVLQADSLPAEPPGSIPMKLGENYLSWSFRGVHVWTGPCAVFVTRGSGAELELMLAGSPLPQGMLAAGILMGSGERGYTRAKCE